MEKPVLDEGAFQQLLAAAYVIQQQMDELQSLRRFASDWHVAQPGSDGALAVVVETREKLRSGTGDAGSAAKLVAEALQRITHASGVAVALERSGKLEYVSAIGTASNLADVSLPTPPDLPAAVAGGNAAPDASAGNAARSTAGDNDIALPLICNGKVAGIIEILFASGGPIQESELNCCQSLAEILAEAISQGAATSTGLAIPASGQVSHRQTGSRAKQRRAERKRRKRALAGEQVAAEDQNLPPVVAGANALALQTSQISLPAMVGESQAISVAPVSPPPAEVWNPWVSSVRARHWLEALERNGPARRWLDLHRSDVYLAGAILILALSIGSLLHNPQSNVPSKTGQPSLSLLERMLVALDLAEPPATPAYAGNPNTMVWVDVRTALYYCPGAELYGKTDGGKMATQRDAQIDQFQPAERKSCN